MHILITVKSNLPLKKCDFDYEKAKNEDKDAIW
jgi:hypothetical protein